MAIKKCAACALGELFISDRDLGSALILSRTAFNKTLSKVVGSFFVPTHIGATHIPVARTHKNTFFSLAHEILYHFSPRSAHSLGCAFCAQMENLNWVACAVEKY
jgi:hypothetical protein